MHRSVLALCIVLIVPGWIFGADLNPNWSVSFDENIEWYKSTPSGHVVVAMKHELAALDPTTGEIAWTKRCRKKIKPGCFEPLCGTSLAILTEEKKVFSDQERVTMLHVPSGNEIWNSQSYGLGKSYGHFLLPQLNALMFYGKQSQKPKKNFVVVVDLATGKEIWHKQEMFNGWGTHTFEIGDRKTIVGNQEPLFDTDSTMILFLSKKSLRKYDARTGDLIWETTANLKRRSSFWDAASEDQEDEPCSGIHLGYAPMLLSQDSSIVYAAYQNTVGAFRTENGEAMWEKPDKLLGIAVDMIDTEYGLLVKSWNGSMSELKMLDYSTGEKIWTAPRAEGSIVKKVFSLLWSETSNMIPEENAVYITTSTDLFRVDLTTGHHEKMTSLGFETVEKYVSLEPRENGYLISGLQNLAWFSLDWERLNNAYYRPADNIGGGLLSLATALAFEGFGTRSLGNGLSLTLSGDVLGAAGTMLEDYSATAESANSVFILAEPLKGEYEGLCLLQVSKTDGAVRNRISLNTREPDYQINQYQNCLVMKTGKKQLVNYQF